MIVLPAIDVIDDRCVRLIQGDFAQQTQYDGHPVDRALAYQAQGARRLHLVNLEGASAQKMMHSSVVKAILETLDIPVQLGGGVRTFQDIRRCFLMGVEQVVLGSLAAHQPEYTRALLQDFGAKRFVVALDITMQDGRPMVMTEAWKNQSGLQLWDVVEQYASSGVVDILCTDVSRDGTMQGPNQALYAEACRRFSDIAWQASGGIRHRADMQRLKASGVAGAIVGKALYGDVNLRALLAEVVC